MPNDDFLNLQHLMIWSTYSWQKRVAIVLGCGLINVVVLFAIVWFPQFLAGVCVGLFLGYYYLPRRKKAAK
ncbi:MAG TPA: hypothetical protein VHS80_01715 [Chthoniobacterales bacterium]|nr:hypothetical protein [Chthoniobacterales bacterium]